MNSTLYKGKTRVENQTKSKKTRVYAQKPLVKIHLWKSIRALTLLSMKILIKKLSTLFAWKKKQFLAGILEHCSLLPQCWQCWSTGGPVTRLYLTFFPLSWGRIWPSRWNHMDSQPVHCTQIAKGLLKIASISDGWGRGPAVVVFSQIHKIYGTYPSVPDPTDPHVFGPPGSGSGSTSQRYGSGSFYHQAKMALKTLMSTFLWLLLDFLSLKMMWMYLQEVP